MRTQFIRGFEVQIFQQLEEKPHPYQTTVIKEETKTDATANSQSSFYWGLYKSFNFASSVKHWNDFSQFPIKSSNVSFLGNLAEFYPFNYYFEGENLLGEHKSKQEAIEDAFRCELEKCNCLQSLIIPCDYKTGYGGVWYIYKQ
jgi:hypothetical protein